MTYQEVYRVGGTRCALHFVEVNEQYPRPNWVTNQLTGRFAWRMFDVATCLWCAT